VKTATAAKLAMIRVSLDW